MLCQEWVVRCKAHPGPYICSQYPTESSHVLRVLYIAYTQDGEPKMNHETTLRFARFPQGIIPCIYVKGTKHGLSREEGVACTRQLVILCAQSIASPRRIDPITTLEISLVISIPWSYHSNCRGPARLPSSLAQYRPEPPSSVPKTSSYFCRYFSSTSYQRDLLLGLRPVS